MCTCVSFVIINSTIMSRLFPFFFLLKEQVWRLAVFKLGFRGGNVLKTIALLKGHAISRGNQIILVVQGFLLRDIMMAPLCYICKAAGPKVYVTTHAMFVNSRRAVRGLTSGQSTCLRICLHFTHPPNHLPCIFFANAVTS